VQIQSCAVWVSVDIGREVTSGAGGEVLMRDDRDRVRA